MILNPITKFYHRWRKDKEKQQTTKQQQQPKEVDEPVRWFGKTKPEQLQSLTTEIEKIETKIALKHVKEMVELLESAGNARGHDLGHHPGDERNLYDVQRRINNFLHDLDAETHTALMGATVKKKERE